MEQQIPNGVPCLRVEILILVEDTMRLSGMPESTAYQDRFGYALKKCENGQFRTMGTEVNGTDGPESVFARLAGELYNDPARGAELFGKVCRLGWKIHDDPHSKTTCWADVYQLVIFGRHEVVAFAGTWNVFPPTQFSAENLAPHEPEALRWAWDLHRPAMVDLRSDGCYRSPPD